MSFDWKLFEMIILFDNNDTRQILIKNFYLYTFYSLIQFYFVHKKTTLCL